MAAVARPIFKDRVNEITQSSGVGDFALAGAQTGFQSFSTAGYVDDDLVYYTVQNGAEWEVGLGTFKDTPDRIERTTVLDSSSGGALVSWPAGDKTIFVTIPAIRVQRRPVVGCPLLGTIDGANTVFTTDEKFVVDGQNDPAVYFQGQRQEPGATSDYVLSESGGVGTGFDTITFAFAPPTTSNLSVDYYVE